MFAGTKKKFLTSGKEEKRGGGRRKERGGGGGEKSRRGFLRPSSFPLSPRTKAAEGKRRRSLGGHDNFRTSISGLDKCGGRCMAPTNPARLEEGGGQKFSCPSKVTTPIFFKKKSRRQVSFLFCGCLQFCFATLRFKRPQRTDDT